MRGSAALFSSVINRLRFENYIEYQNTIFVDGQEVVIGGDDEDQE